MSSFDWTSERVDQLVALRKDGMSASEIAAKLGCGSRSAVLGKIMRLRDNGVIEGPRAFEKNANYKPAARGRHVPGLPHIPVIKTLLGEGRTDREIADEIGIKPDDVRYVRRIKGWKANSHVRPIPAFAAELTKLVLAGRSDREVAATLGISLYQARWERRRQGVKPAAGTKMPQPRVTTIVKGDTSEKVMAVFKEGFMGQRARVSLVNLPLHGKCRYPIDQPEGPVRYCGDHADEGAVYCSHHAARCYVAVEPRKALRPSHVYGARR